MANPAYKGPWTAPVIKNPLYVGESSWSPLRWWWWLWRWWSSKLDNLTLYCTLLSNKYQLNSGEWAPRKIENALYFEGESIPNSQQILMNERLFMCYLTAAPHLFQLLELWIMITTDTSPFPSIPFPSIPFDSFPLYGVLDASPVNSLAPMAGIAVEVWTTNAGKMPRHRNIRHFASCFIVSCQVMSVSHHIISYHVILCHVISFHVISYHIVNFTTAAYRLTIFFIFFRNILWQFRSGTFFEWRLHFCRCYIFSQSCRWHTATCTPLPPHPLPPPFFTHNPFLTHTANGYYHK